MIVQIIGWVSLMLAGGCLFGVYKIKADDPYIHYIQWFALFLIAAAICFK